MWRLLPLILLVSCATHETDDATTQDAGQDGFRVVRTVNLPLISSSSTSEPSSQKTFSRQDIQGSLQETGAWNISLPVAHTRLRCATYETGIQVGEGNPDCSDTRWLSPVQFGTRRTHCNSAQLIHSGGGQFATGKDLFEASNCVRVVTRCEGPC